MIGGLFYFSPQRFLSPETVSCFRRLPALLQLSLSSASCSSPAYLVRIIKHTPEALPQARQSVGHLPPPLASQTGRRAAQPIKEPLKSLKKIDCVDLF